MTLVVRRHQDEAGSADADERLQLLQDRVRTLVLVHQNVRRHLFLQEHNLSPADPSSRPWTMNTLRSRLSSGSGLCSAMARTSTENSSSFMWPGQKLFPVCCCGSIRRRRNLPARHDGDANHVRYRTVTEKSTVSHVLVAEYVAFPLYESICRRCCRNSQLRWPTSPRFGSSIFFSKRKSPSLKVISTFLCG